MITTPPSTRGERLANRLLSFILVLVAAVTGIYAALYATSLIGAALVDVVHALLPESLADDSDMLSATWPMVWGRLIIFTSVAIVSGMGARHVLRKTPTTPASR